MLSLQIMAATHLKARSNSLGGAEGTDAGSGNSNGSYGKRGELHGCLLICFTTLFFFLWQRRYRKLGSQKSRQDRSTHRKCCWWRLSEAYVSSREHSRRKSTVSARGKLEWSYVHNIKNDWHSAYVSSKILVTHWQAVLSKNPLLNLVNHFFLGVWGKFIFLFSFETFSSPRLKENLVPDSLLWKRKS